MTSFSRHEQQQQQQQQQQQKTNMKTFTTLLSKMTPEFYVAPTNPTRSTPTLMQLSSTAHQTLPDHEEAYDDEYFPPKVWTPSKQDLGGKWGSGINRPTAGARYFKELPKGGNHPLQLYSMGTPNGNKATIMLEELLELGHTGAEYDAWYINIADGDQFGSGFVDINPNSKIPVLVDTTTTNNNGTRIFESGSILLQLSEKFDNAFMPKELRSEVLNWLFWAIGSAPFLGGGFGHFYSYAPKKFQYALDRYTMETKRQLDVLNQQLAKSTYITGDEYTLADIAIYPWWGRLVLGDLYDDSEIFLNVIEEYPHVIRWAKIVSERPAVQRGTKVNRNKFLKERH